MRTGLMGIRRLCDFAELHDMPWATLTARSARLAREGLLRRVRYEERPERFEYWQTEQSTALYGVLAAR